jgi:hypothetical protein
VSSLATTPTGGSRRTGPDRRTSCARTSTRCTSQRLRRTDGCPRNWVRYTHQAFLRVDVAHGTFPWKEREPAHDASSSASVLGGGLGPWHGRWVPDCETRWLPSRSCCSSTHPKNSQNPETNSLCFELVSSRKAWLTVS